MSEQTCDCCEQDEVPTDTTSPLERWLDDRPVEEASLPPDMRRHAGRFLGEPVETTGDLVAAIRAAVGGPLTVDELCHTAKETPHTATVGEETYTFECFFDGVGLAFLADGPVTVRTESPAGVPVEVIASPDGEVETTPPGAVMSLGIASDVAEPETDADRLEAAYAAVCPYVKAFGSRTGYLNWAAGGDGATVGMPLAAGMSVAKSLTEGH